MVKILENYFQQSSQYILLRIALAAKKQSEFRPGDSTANQLIGLVNAIHHAFDSIKSLEVHAIFLDICKALDKVWYNELIFKMRQMVGAVGY